MPLPETLPLIIAYDIRCPRRWRKVHKLLVANAFALQLSVFAADWTENELHAMQGRLNACLDREADDLRIFRVPLAVQGYRFGPWRGTGTSVLALGSPVLSALERLKTG